MACTTIDQKHQHKIIKSTGVSCTGSREKGGQGRSGGKRDKKHIKTTLKNGFVDGRMILKRREGGRRHQPTHKKHKHARGGLHREERDKHNVENRLWPK